MIAVWMVSVPLPVLAIAVVLALVGIFYLVWEAIAIRRGSHSCTPACSEHHQFDETCELGRPGR